MTKKRRGKRKRHTKPEWAHAQSARVPVVLELRNPALKGSIQIELPPGWKKKEFPKPPSKPAKNS
jgi:hypothetical protein